MVALMDLWLPILVSAGFVFVVSSIIHMILPIHRSDVTRLPGEEGLLTALRDQGVKRGTYMFPFPKSMQEMGTPEMLAKYNLGPVGFMTVLDNGPPAIGKSLMQWFVFSVLISTVIGYVASLALTPETTSLTIFRFTATIALVAYGLSNVTDSIWKGVPWIITAKFLFDGLLYGLATGGAFVWLWPNVA